MKKTNIRINNNFLIKQNDEYFLSDVSDYDSWINTNDLNDHKGNNVTNEYQELSDKYSINYNVNFITNQSGGWGPKVIQSGGWGGKVIQSGGGWGPKVIQSGGWGSFKKDIQSGGGWPFENK